MRCPLRWAESAVDVVTCFLLAEHIKWDNLGCLFWWCVPLWWNSSEMSSTACYWGFLWLAAFSGSHDFHSCINIILCNCYARYTHAVELTAAWNKLSAAHRLSIKVHQNTWNLGSEAQISAWRDLNSEHLKHRAPVCKFCFSWWFSFWCPQPLSKGFHEDG